MTTEQQAAQLFGYEVVDSDGNKVGKVDNVWVDDATNALEFVGVKTGWLMGKTHVIPATNAQISGEQVKVPFDQDTIKNAPSFAGDEELTPEQEDEIYNHYGEGRSTSESPSGLAAGAGTSSDTSSGVAETAGTTGTGYTDSSGSQTDGEQNLTLHEEDLAVGKREVEAGRVRLRKVVHTDHKEVPVDLRREEVSVERVPARGEGADDSAFQEQEVDIPVMREEAVVGKEARPTEQVRVNKDVQTETRSVGGQVRREDVEGDEGGEPGTLNRDVSNADTTGF